MERKKKGLFGRLLEFWRGKISMGETDRIGFWNDTEHVEKHFAEMGAVSSLSQRETKKAFWEETAENILEEKGEEREVLFEKKRGQKGLLFAEKTEEKQTQETEEKQTQETEEGTAEKQKPSVFFTAKVFQKEGQETTEGTVMGRNILWEEPIEEKEKRRIVPVTAEGEQEEKPAEKEQEMLIKEVTRKEEEQEKPTLDIEKLMREMTKKLWEERESCGRRLR